MTDPDDFDALVDQLEALIEQIDRFPDEVRQPVLELLDGLDLVHRHALHQLAALVGPAALSVARADPAVHWLLDAYDVRPPEPVPVELRTGPLTR